MNQFTLIINLVDAGKVSVDESVFLNLDEAPKIRVPIREHVKSIADIVRDEYSSLRGQILKVVILCWKESTQVHVAIDDGFKRNDIDKHIDAIVELMTSGATTSSSAS
jgi:hypothetical protein